MHRGRGWVAWFLLAGTLAVPASPPAVAAVRPCSSGLVALTFDDGPAATVTPALLDALTKRGVPATFFVVGQRVVAAPNVVRMAHRRGFTVANHTYRHEQLTRLGDEQIRRTLRATRQAIAKAGATPFPLMRPPYGLIDGRVRSVVAGLGMTPVLWDIDPQDWRPLSGPQIAARVLGALREHESNIVLLHDGVGNSGSTLSAVPEIVRRARERGYCFARLDRSGRPAPPVPAVRVGDDAVVEGRAGTTTSLRFTVRLDRPTSRETSLRVRTDDRSAAAGVDYRAVDHRVRLPAGTTSRVVRVSVRGDALDERDERLVLTASAPRGVTLADRQGAGIIRDDDDPPRLRLSDSHVMEPTDGTATARIALLLNRPSGRRVTVRVETRAGSADTSDYVPLGVTVRFAPGRTRREVAVQVLADDVPEGLEAFSVRVTSARHVTVVDGVATVTIEPAPPPPEEQPPTDP